MTNKSKTLYTGVTDNLERRVYEHKNKLIEGFTKKYNITKLVYYEMTNDVQSAIEREKQIKGWLRRKKIALIEAANPKWTDLRACPKTYLGRSKGGVTKADVILREQSDRRISSMKSKSEILPLHFVQGFGSHAQNDIEVV